MKIRPLKNENQYNEVLSRIYELMQLENREGSADELEILSLLVKDYESEHYPISKSVETIKRKTEQEVKIKSDIEEALNEVAELKKAQNKKQNLTNFLEEL